MSYNRFKTISLFIKSERILRQIRAQSLRWQKISFLVAYENRLQRVTHLRHELFVYHISIWFMVGLRKRAALRLKRLKRVRSLRIRWKHFTNLYSLLAKIWYFYSNRVKPLESLGFLELFTKKLWIMIWFAFVSDNTYTSRPSNWESVTREW